MKYSKKQIECYSNNTSFIKNYIEKVVRLLGVLNYLFSESGFKDKLVLKGGTAINLAYTNLKRLSVDIDLDYCGSLDRSIAQKDRELLEQELDNYMIQEEYEISSKSRSSFALFSRVYRYQNAFGNSDAIKVDINFLDRVHLYPLVNSSVTYFDKTAAIRIPSIEELFGMKITALIDRSKPRDLYDCGFLIDHFESFDKNMLRKAVIFYLSLDSIFEISDSTFAKIKSITQRNVKTELQPVLRKEEKFSLEDAKKSIIETLKELLTLTEDEKQYLIEHSKGNYNPSLLFDSQIASGVENHPMAKWRAINTK